MLAHINKREEEKDVQCIRAHCTPFGKKKTLNRKTIIATEIFVLNSSDFYVFMCICLETSNEKSISKLYRQTV